MIRKLKTKDFLNFQDFLKTNLFSDNTKLLKRIFNDSVKRSNQALVSDENSLINGVLLVSGIIDKSEKKHLTIITKDVNIANKLLEVYIWNCKTDLYCNIKKDNPIFRILVGDNFYFRKVKKEREGKTFLTNGFRLISEDKENFYLYRKYEPRFDYTLKPIFVKEDDKNDNK